MFLMPIGTNLRQDTDPDAMIVIHDVAMRHFLLKFAPSLSIMGKLRISGVTSSTSVTHVVWKTVKTTRGSIDKFQKVTPRRKGRQAMQSKASPTVACSSIMAEHNVFQNGDEDAYQELDDPPPLKQFKTTKNQVEYYSTIYYPVSHGHRF